VLKKLLHPPNAKSTAPRKVKSVCLPFIGGCRSFEQTDNLFDLPDVAVSQFEFPADGTFFRLLSALDEPDDQRRNRQSDNHNDPKGDLNCAGKIEPVVGEMDSGNHLLDWLTSHARPGSVLI
jgi:hypothetical protein